MRLLLILFSFLLGLSTIKSQSNNIQNSVILKEGKLYNYQNKSYRIGELGFLFEGKTDLSDQYNKALRNLNTGKGFGYTTLGLWGVGAFAIAVDNREEMYCDTICLTTGDVVGIISIILISPITGTVALITHFKGKSKMNNLIDTYNQIQLDTYGRKIEHPQIGLSKKGVGLSISF